MRSRNKKLHPDILLKNGLVVDGTGGKPYEASLLLRGGLIRRISRTPFRSSGLLIDCAGKVIAPGFVDAHSHMDLHMAVKAHDELKYPFAAQGITTIVGGHCGVSPVALREGSLWRPLIETEMLSQGAPGASWETMSSWLDQFSGAGISHNVALLAGHGTSRVSIRGMDSAPLHPYETKELLRLLEVAMDQGARGVSIGLHDAPGAFAQPDELKEIALLVRRKGMVLAVRPRSLAAVVPVAHTRLLGEPANLVALREILDLAKATGVRLNVSHMLFIGSRTWRTCETALKMIENAIQEGVDVRFDASPYPSTAIRIGAFLPQWFMARLPEEYRVKRSMRLLRRQLLRVDHRLGLGAADVLVAEAADPDISEYKGLSIAEIARLRRVHPVDVLVDIARRSRGNARLFVRRCGTGKIVQALASHPACLYATGAMAEPGEPHNPAALAAFPAFLRLARESGSISLEEAVHKMSGATAERFGLTGRGFLKENHAADITVFDWQEVRDEEAEDGSGVSPRGIEYLFMNGIKVIGSGKRESPLNAGVPLA